MDTNTVQTGTVRPTHQARENKPALWNVDDVARFLKVSRSWVYKAAENGQIPCRRVGALLRFVPARIEAWAMGTDGDAAGGRTAKVQE